ncbi:AAA domain-containing protein [Patescibacteria group bacterium]|jgi:ATP-dependent Clp protease ATP-binding subunit ClpC|nr:AAA domain-containing protein [Patescibacteria group bacterium]
MSFDDLKALCYRFYRPILALEDTLPYPSRRAWETRLTLVVALVLLATLVSFVFTRLEGTIVLPMAAGSVAELFPLFLGALLIVTPARLSLLMLEAFHRSYYFRGLAEVLAEALPEEEPGVSFEVAAIVHYTPGDDVVAGFLRGPYGQDVCYRLGIEDSVVHAFLSDPMRTTLSGRDFLLERDHGGVTLPVYARSLFKQDQAFADWLFKQRVQRDELVGAAEWVMRSNRRDRQRERWWSRDQLGRIESIGIDLVYGERFTLSRYGTEIEKDPVYEAARGVVLDEDGDVEAIETELARARQANVILVGADDAGKRDTLAQLAHKIKDGRILPPLAHKHVFLFDVTALLSASSDRSFFESTLIKALNEATHAGNIILVLEEFPAALAGAKDLGSDLVNLLLPYFSSPALQIIVTTGEEALHRTLERDSRIKQAFEIVRLHEVDEGGLLRILEQRSVKVERRVGVVMTYQALRAVAHDAKRYFPDAVMPDKALDLLEEAALYAGTHDIEFIQPAHVSAVVEGKTGIPLGDVDEVESDALQHLEEELQERVIGQRDALKSVAGAVRRARAGINDPDRPIGTFLFLGPTGVGKTETAKALAHVFFGAEDAMHRLDMSEFQGADAVGRLIGLPNGTPGRLSSMLRESPYRVLLLDEFEKADRSVHDLFLQILDEGEFSDQQGDLVNARNTIVIATSNAGADLIFKSVEEGKNLAEQEDEILNEIISRGTFRPELVNRFDAMILFRPLAPDEARQVARLALEDLRTRLKEKGFDLTITDELLDHVAREGYDVRFGGRNINRYLKEHVEQVIADKIIKGTVAKGQTIVLEERDLRVS